METALEPELEIVDAHQHFWDSSRRGRYLFDDIVADIEDSGHNVTATTYVECGSMYREGGPPELAPLGEIEFANGIAAMSASGRYGPCRVAAAIVGRADLSLGRAVRDVLEAGLALSGGRLRGIRHGLAWDPSPVIMGSRTSSSIKLPSRLATPKLAFAGNFREGLSQLAPLGLVFDCFALHPQLGDVLDLARAFPETTFVLNHGGGLLRVGPYAEHQDAALAEWKNAITSIAQCPNVNVKLGGLGMSLFAFTLASGAVPPTSAELADAWRETVEYCIDAFGVGRCMFESNFPQDNETCSYATMWNAFKRITRSASPAEKQALYSGTAKRVYRLSPPSRDEA